MILDKRCLTFRLLPLGELRQFKIHVRYTERYPYMYFTCLGYRAIHNQKNDITQYFSGDCVGCVQEGCFLQALHAFLHALCWFDILELGRRMRGQQTSLFQFHLSLPLSSLAVLSCGGPKSSPFQTSFPEPDPSALELAARTVSAI